MAPEMIAASAAARGPRRWTLICMLLFLRLPFPDACHRFWENSNLLEVSASGRRPATERDVHDARASRILKHASNYRVEKIARNCKRAEHAAIPVSNAGKKKASAAMRARHSSCRCKSFA